MSQSAKCLPARESPLVMIVDDSEDIREIIKLALNSRGYKIVEAVNGEEALKIARRECPDLILMDLSMPLLDGFGAARGIREIEKICDVPIVAISAHNTVDHRAKAFAVGFNGYLTKPINFAQLFEFVHRFLAAA